jgi:hypothetical protein
MAQDQSVQGDTATAPEKEYKPITPYQAAKAVTSAMRRRGNADFEMQPQTMYGLASRQVIPTLKWGPRKSDGEQKIHFDGKAFSKWLKNFLAGEGAGSGTRRLDYDKLADEYLDEEDFDDESAEDGKEDDLEADLQASLEAAGVKDFEQIVAESEKVNAEALGEGDKSDEGDDADKADEAE